MKRSWFLSLGLVLGLALLLSCTCLAQESGETFETEWFSLRVPSEILELADVDVTERGIAFYEKQSREEFGGLVGQIAGFESASDYLYIPHFQKCGEIDFDDGRVLNIVLILTSDVQYDYFNAETKDCYFFLLEKVKEFALQITPAEGGTLLAPEEIDHTGIYSPLLYTLQADIKKEKSPEALEADGFSGLCANVYGSKKPLKGLSYLFLDMEGIGYPQLAILETKTQKLLDLYGQLDGEYFHLLSATEKESYGFCGEPGYVPRFLYKRVQENETDYSITLYILDLKNQGLYEQMTFLYRESQSPENPYFFLYNSDEEPVPATEEDWQQRVSNFPILEEVEGAKKLSKWEK